MSDGFPSMTALLGLLAVAGFQNRDKIGEWLGSMNPGAAPAGGPGAQPQPQLQGYQPQGSQPQGYQPQGYQPSSAGSRPPALENILANMRGQHPDSGSFLGSAVGNLVDKFRQAGQGPAADSWVNRGPNQEIAPPDLEHALGSDTLSALEQQTGLSRQEIVARLSRELPNAVDRYTPDGRVPAYGAG